MPESTYWTSKVELLRFSVSMCRTLLSVSRKIIHVRKGKPLRWRCLTSSEVCVISPLYSYGSGMGQVLSNPYANTSPGRPLYEGPSPSADYNHRPKQPPVNGMVSVCETNNISALSCSPSSPLLSVKRQGKDTRQHSFLQ